MIPGIIVNKAIDIILKRFKLDKLLDYVENDNETDLKVKDHEKRLKKLETALKIREK